jgi:hypothetical protein
MNRTELRKRLTGVSIEDRVPIIEEYFQELSEKEIEKYKKFYESSLQALKQSKGVTKAKNNLENNGYLDPFGRIHYSTLHQMACVAAGQEIRTPSMEMESNGVKTKQTLRKNRQGKSVGRLMEQKPAKIKVSKRRYETLI